MPGIELGSKQACEREKEITKENNEGNKIRIMSVPGSIALREQDLVKERRTKDEGRGTTSRGIQND